MNYSSLMKELGLNKHEIKYYTTSINKFIPYEITQKYGKKRKVYTLVSNKDRLFYIKLKNIIEREASELISKMKYYHSYIPGKSIVTNANVHVGAKYVLKLDLKNYFESFNFLFVVKSLSKIFEYECALFIAKCVCIPYKKYKYASYTYHSFLPIGIPTSPIISTISSRYIDTYTIKLLSSNNLKSVKYSRYSDDITFSTNEQYIFDRLHSLLDYDKFEKALKETFTLNKKKTKILGPKSPKRVTGITINEKLNVSKEFYGKIRLNLVFAKKDFNKTKEQYRIKNVNHISSENFKNADYEHRLRSSISYIGNVIGTNNPRYKKLALLFNLVEEFENRIPIHNIFEDNIASVEIFDKNGKVQSQGTAFLSCEYGLISNFHVFEECLLGDKFVFKNYDIRLLFSESKEFDKHGLEYILNFENYSDSDIYYSKELDYISFPEFKKLVKENLNEYIHSDTSYYLHYDTQLQINQTVTVIGYPNNRRDTLETKVIGFNKKNIYALEKYLNNGASGSPVLYKNKIIGIYTQINEMTSPNQGEFIFIENIKEDIREKKEKKYEK